MITCLTQEHTNWEALHWEKWFETLVSAYPGLILFLLTELQTDQCFTKIITYHKGPCRIKNLITFMVKQNKFSTTRGTPYIHGTNLWLKKNWEKFANLPSNERPLLFNLGSCQVIVQSSCSVVSNSLPPHGLQHSRLPCPSPTPGACSNTCPSWWGHPTISSCHPLLLPSILPSIRVFSNKSVLCIRWPKY